MIKLARKLAEEIGETIQVEYNTDCVRLIINRKRVTFDYPLSLDDINDTIDILGYKTQINNVTLSAPIRLLVNHLNSSLSDTNFKVVYTVTKPLLSLGYSDSEYTIVASNTNNVITTVSKKYASINGIVNYGYSFDNGWWKYEMV